MADIRLEIRNRKTGTGTDGWNAQHCTTLTSWQRERTGELVIYTMTRDDERPVCQQVGTSWEWKQASRWMWQSYDQEGLGKSECICWTGGERQVWKASQKHMGLGEEGRG